MWNQAPNSEMRSIFESSNPSPDCRSSCPNSTSHEVGAVDRLMAARAKFMLGKLSSRFWEKNVTDKPALVEENFEDFVGSLPNLLLTFTFTSSLRSLWNSLSTHNLRLPDQAYKMFSSSRTSIWGIWCGSRFPSRSCFNIAATRRPS